ncbi:MAG: exo-alpha-sialidase [Alistipes sp.]|nr:exo-alpha-sialidase [Alistipes sp.]
MKTKMIYLSVLAMFAVWTSAAQTPELAKPDGVVVAHTPKSETKYVGSPSIAVSPSGVYVASHDFFGKRANINGKAVTVVYTSKDKGATWSRAATVLGQYWSNLFYIGDNLYLLGVERGHGNIVIRRSTDDGRTWTTPADERSGLLFRGAYHTAPTPVIVANGRIWRAFEKADAMQHKSNFRYGPLMISAAADADLLDASSWRMSNHITVKSSYADGECKGVLEGNAVADRDGHIVDVLRMHVWPGAVEHVLIARVSDDGATMSFDPESDFIPFEGGSKKFSIRFDVISGRYWTLANDVMKEHAGEYPAAVRNSLVLMSSPDLRRWTKHLRVLHHPDTKLHGFQYVDWLADGEDMVFVSRTAFDDEFGGADNYHNANYLTFHRIENFRKYEKEIVE